MVLDLVSFWVKRDCGEDFGRDCKSIRGKPALVMQERKGRRDKIQILKGVPLFLGCVADHARGKKWILKEVKCVPQTPGNKWEGKW